MILASLFALMLAVPQDAPMPATTPEARLAAERFGACIADSSPELSAHVLTMDFTTPAYRRALRRLSDNNRTCFDRRGRMRASHLALAGAIAERLLERDPSPLNVRLARAAALPATPAYGPSDRIAICVVRAVPDDVAALFATPVASEAETAASRTLAPATALCAKGTQFSVTIDGMRAILATAAFRSAGGAAR